MATASRDDNDEDYKAGGVTAVMRSKPRFSLTEVTVLLEAVKRNRYVVLRKFNQGVSSDTKKQMWAEITAQVNGLGENQREVRQIMKKWADLKCDGKRRIAALRGPNGVHVRKKNLGPVEKMVHKILMMSPRGDGDSDLDLGDDEDSSRLYCNPPPYSYLSLTENSHPLPAGASLELSPLSSPEKEAGGDLFHSSSDFDVGEDGECALDFEEDESLFSSLAPPPCADPLPDNTLLRVKPVYTYSRAGGQNHNHIQNHNYSRPSSSSSCAAPPPPESLAGAASSSASAPPPPAAQPRPSSAGPSDPLPAGASSAGPSDHVAQMAWQGVQQQRASRMLLSSVSQSLEALAQSVQLLVESQQEFVQESLLLQRETVDVLRDFSNAALAMLRDKAGGGRNHHHQQQQPPQQQ